MTYKRTGDKDEQAAIASGGAPTDNNDPEKNAVKSQPIGQQKTKKAGEGDAIPGIKKSETVFLWKDLNYTVPVKGGHRQLLNNIQGYTKVRPDQSRARPLPDDLLSQPGSLTALMGSSVRPPDVLDRSRDALSPLVLAGCRKDDPSRYVER